MADRTLSIIIDAKDNASRVFAAMGRSASQSTDEIERAARDAERTLGDLGQAADRAGRDLGDLGQSAERADRSLDEIGDNSRHLDDLSRDAGRAAGKLGELDRAADQSSESLGRQAKAQEAFNRAGAAFGAIGGALVDVTLAASAAYAESEARVERLIGSIETAGQSYADFQGQIEAATETGLSLGFDDDDVLDSISSMTQAFGDTQAALDQLSLAQDLARARNIDLAAATNIVIAAEQGRYGPLARMGIAIDENMSSEQALMALRELSAGQAERYADSTAGAIDRMTNRVGNAMETIGSHLTGVAPYVQMLGGLGQSYTVVLGLLGALMPKQAAATASTASLAASQTALGTSGAAGAVGVAAAGTASTAAGTAMTGASVAARALSAALAATPIGIGLLAAGMVAAIAASIIFQDETDESAESQKRLADATDTASESMNGFIAAAQDASTQQMLISIQDSQQALLAHAQASQAARDAVREHGDALGMMEAGTINPAIIAVQRLADGTLELVAGMQQAELDAVAAAGGQEQLNAAMADGILTVGELAEIERDLISAADEAASAVERTAQVLEAGRQPGQNYAAVVNEVKSAWDEYNASTDPNRLETLNSRLETINATLANTTGAQAAANQKTEEWLNTLSRFDEGANETWERTVTGAEGVDAAINAIFSSTADGAMAAQAAYWEASAALREALNDADPTNDMEAWTTFNATVKATAETLPEVTEATVELTEEMKAAAAESEKFSGIITSYQRKINPATRAVDDLASNMNYLAESTEDESAQIDAWLYLVNNGLMTVEEFAYKVDALADAQRSNTGATEEAAAAQAEMTAETERTIAAIERYNTTLDEQNSKIDELDSNLKYLAESENANQREIQRLIDLRNDGKISNEQFAESIDRITTAVQAEDEAEAAANAERQQTIDSINAFRASADPTAEAVANIGRNLDDLSDSSEETRAQVEELNRQYEAGTISAEEYALGLQEIVDAEARAAAEAETLNTVMEALVETWREFVGGLWTAINNDAGFEALLSLSDAMDEFDDSQKEVVRSSREAIAILNDLQDASEGTRDAVEDLNNEYRTTNMTAEEYVARLREIQAEEQQLAQDLETVNGALAAYDAAMSPAAQATAELNSNLVMLAGASTGAQERVAALRAEWEAGTITAEEFALGVAEIAEEERDAAEAAAELAAAQKRTTDAIEGYRRANNPAAQATDNLATNMEYLADASDEARMATELLIWQHEQGIITDEQFAVAIAGVADAERDAAAQTAEMAAETERLRDEFVNATAAALELAGGIDTLAEKLVYQNLAGPAAELAANLSNATSQAQDLYRVIVGNTNAIASSANQTMAWADELVNVRGVWGEIDDLRARGLISDEDYAQAQDAYDAMALANQGIQDYVKSIQAQLIPYMADAMVAQEAWLKTIAESDEQTQLATLGYMDMAKSQQALSVAQMMASATTKEQQAQVGDMVTAMAMADPVLKAMLIDMGLISEQDGVIEFHFDNADATVATLDDVVDAVTMLAEVLAQAFGLEINVDQDDVEAAEEAVTQLQGAVASIPPSVAVGIPIATQGAAAGEVPADVIDALLGKLTELDETETEIALDGTAVEAVKTLMTDAENKAKDVDRGRYNINLDGVEIVDATDGIEALEQILLDVDRGVTDVRVNDYSVALANNALRETRSLVQQLDNSVIDIEVRYTATGDRPDGRPRMLGGVVGTHLLGGTSVPAYALGGQMSLVGEAGPELVRLPYGAMVTPASATRARLGGGADGPVNFYGPVTVVANDPQQLMRKLRSQRVMEARS